MKTTGIVRRVEVCVIIGQTAPNPHKHWGFHCFCPKIFRENRLFSTILAEGGLFFTALGSEN